MLWLEALDERIVPDGTMLPDPSEPPPSSSPPASPIPTITLEVGVPLYLGTEDGGDEIYLTLTEDDNLFIQVVHLDGTQTALSFGNDANPNNAGVPANASSNFHPAPEKPVWVFDPVSGTWTFFESAQSGFSVPGTGYPNGQTGGWETPTANFVIPPGMASTPPTPPGQPSPPAPVIPKTPPAPIPTRPIGQPAPTPPVAPSTPVIVQFNISGNENTVNVGGIGSPPSNPTNPNPPSPTPPSQPNPPGTNPPAQPPQQGVMSRTLDDGTVMTVNPITGTVTYEKPDGTIIVVRRDGSRTVISPATSPR